MKVLLAQQNNKYFEWQILTWLNYHKEMDFEPLLLFLGKPNAFTNKLSDMYEVYVYEDERKDKSYIPAIRHFLIEKYLEEHGDVNEPVLFTDSDTMYKKVPELGQSFSPEASESVNGYMGRKYWEQCTDQKGLESAFYEAYGFTQHDMPEPALGGQWLFQNITKEMWAGMSNDMTKAYKVFQKEQPHTNAQLAWVSEMILMAYKFCPVPNSDLDFDWATDYEWNNNVLHFAGITSSKMGFYKGEYVNRFPTHAELHIAEQADNNSKLWAQAIDNTLYRQL